MPLPKLPTVLRGTTLIVSGASAFSAYPAASSLLGDTLGLVAVGAVTTVVYSCWHYVGTQSGSDENSWYHRIGAGLVAAGGAAVMVAGIGVSAGMQTNLITQQAATAADTLYTQQESARFALLKTLSEKLEITDNRSDPKDYKRLSDQIDKAMIPTPRQETASQKSTVNIPSEYKWTIAGTLEGSIPVLLVLAGLFELRQRKADELTKKDQLPTVAQPIAQGQQQDNSTNPPGNSADSPETPDSMEIFSNKVVPINEKCAVTIQAIAEASGKSAKLARAIRDQAGEEGWLKPIGNGNATTWHYWDYTPAETQLPLLRSVS